MAYSTFTWTLCAALLSTPTIAQIWENKGAPATVVELFTSEGCSSCPPAEAALNALADNKELWTKLIPLAFHVDYWNYIGWQDRFSQPAFSQRQRDKVRETKASGVYTPGWFINDQEWRGFFARQPIPYDKGPNSAALKAQLRGNKLFVEYGGSQKLKANYALIAMDERTEVKQGENRGKILHHHFVVLDFDNKQGKTTWVFSTQVDKYVNADAIAVWLTLPEGGDPIQTVAGWLEQSKPQ